MSLSTTPSNEVLNRILNDLKSRSEETKYKAANELRDHVISISREISGENFTKFINDVNRRIFSLIQSNDNDEKIGGILAIDKLIDFDGEENTTKITRFANYLRFVLPGNDLQTMVLASKALGRLAQSGGTLTPEFVEFEVKRALEWLQGDRHESKRYAAVLVLKELAQNAPILIYAYVPKILNLIWVVLKDPKVVIREGAADALSVCLVLIQQRDGNSNNSWYSKILEEAQRGLKFGSSDTIHGCLLVIRELLLHTGNFMDQYYKEIADIVLKNRDNKDSLIRRTVILLMSDLADFNARACKSGSQSNNEDNTQANKLLNSIFVKNYLDDCMIYLLSQLKKDRDRSIVFTSIGKIAIAVESNIGPYLDSVTLNIKEVLTQKSRYRVGTEVYVFQCISMLATAVGQVLTKHMHELLDIMLAQGLSEALTQALSDLAHYIPPLLPTIQDRLLNVLSIILSGQPYHHPSSSFAKQANLIQTQMRDLQITEGHETEIIILALKTLGTFDFSGHMLNEFVREYIVRYLEDDNAEVRKSAAITCCHLLVNDPVCYQTSNNSMQIVGEVLEKLLTVGITDSDAQIRKTVLSSLDERFDHHLAQAENIRTLFLALNDEVFAIREVTISIIGRLIVHNPAYIMPSLRKTLIQLLSEIEYSGVNCNKEEAARLLSHLIKNSRRLIKPYVEPLLKVLIPKCKDPSPGVASESLKAIGELALIGEDMVSYLDDLFPMIIETLQDQSNITKREVALKTLGQLASNTGYIIEPYIKYPNLLNILIGILKTEQNMAIRRQTVKVMGILGALDPYKHKMALRNPNENISNVSSETPKDNLPLGLSPSSEEYYPTVAINALMRILRDPSLSVHHTAVVQAVIYIFKTLGLKCVSFLPQIMPAFLNMMRVCQVGNLEFYFQQLGILVTVVKQHIRNYLTEIYQLIQEFWNFNSNIQLTIISLMESIAIALNCEFKAYLPQLLPQLLQIFETDTSEKRQLTIKVLKAFIVFGSNLEEYLHLVIPVIIKLFERIDAPLDLRREAIQTIGNLCKNVNFSDHASRIIHPLVRILPNTELRNDAMDTLIKLVLQLNSDYAIFVPMVNKILIKNHIQHAEYDNLVTKLLKNEPLQRISDNGEESMDSNLDDNLAAEITTKKLPVNQQHLKKAWEASQRSTKEDWMEWLRRLSVELLKESPSPALRACASLAAVYYPLSRELFNAGFVSCWSELYDQFQDELVHVLETALVSPNIPPELIQTLLNLAEFMEHDDKALPIDIKTLGGFAAKCHTYAKALHYKELEFISEPKPSNIEALISINNQLQQPDSAIGILTYAQENHDIKLKESWYEKLQRWEDALAAYERKQLEDPLSIEATIGRMRCLHALGEWEALSQLVKEKWVYASEDTRKTMAPLAAGSAWGLSDYELMEEYIGVMKPDSPDGSFFRAILNVNGNLYPQAEQYINKTRDLLDTELTALVGESYNRAYSVVVRIQMLAELEEIITYKKLFDQPERQETIRKTWMKRLKGCQKNIDIWHRILRIQALVISPKENMEMWIKFANLCRKGGRLNTSLKTLLTLSNNNSLDGDPMNNPPPVVYAYLKYLWAIPENRNHAYQIMKIFTKDLVNRLENSSYNDISYHMDNNSNMNNYQNSIKLQKLIARCYLRLGEWQKAQTDELTIETIPEILSSLHSATHYDSEWYKAWHAWALTNFEVINYYEKASDSNNVSAKDLIEYVKPSIFGFFKSIALSKSNSLQDTLRLITLWFKYGYNGEVNAAVNDGLSRVSVDTWLQVIPQLIARIYTNHSHVRNLLQQLLTDVGKEHPQALVYSLTVASKSPNIERQNAANSIMEKMMIHSATLVNQALLVSQELIRVAILWHEMWHEGIEEASRLYFGNHNIEGMFATLQPLHQMLEKGPETMREISFNQGFGRDLSEALDWCRKYTKTKDINDLNQAWDLYYTVFRKINKQLPQLTSLELKYVSPKLLNARDLELAVPGQYRSGEPVIRIQSFIPTLNIITSKQRPRRLSIKGSDGKEYQYLLKGHEDLRQDERVMQLFGLINTLLADDPETFTRHMNIQRYPVIPLSPNSGLIGWVPHCDTLHALIRDYRESKKTLLNIEHRLMLQMAPDYDNLTLLQKVEVFEYAADNTTGQDLYKVLWIKSRNSEAWLDRRTNYTRSLAVMSMVGYILGLGDRHPSNLMLDRFTGKVVHIDFGDCFEVAMHREKFPERIPFRLTRMLINAMEVSGIEGNFRITCEHVMRVLRENKDSLMAVLEAFVYDPLINWRLITNPSPKIDNKPTQNKRNDDENHNFYGNRKQRNENDLVNNEEIDKVEYLNPRAVQIVNRIQNKLTGRDFKPNNVLDVRSQVYQLIEQATSVENLCQCYIGWCAFW
ncbi:phosphatidylinositol kinase Tor2 [Piromyces finnis]|uniref:Serine/threonine-protein kinase TOR n=1 Tax=Piromyces finnis TaxID=1754191 RepID=A0A1Y1VC79_9FUNG|nr:phosphatidylinositol kinase Tor2 [Piromyces finnis]|eukprot:ORX52573.1 phosphatidylinositol kinase Tor2 [Piromyces finnis]